jgi:hypothetical protein
LIGAAWAKLIPVVRRKDNCSVRVAYRQSDFS